MPKQIRWLSAVTVAIMALAPAGSVRAGTIPVQPGSSIQKAIDRAEPGDTVAVAPGTYTENLVIRAKSDLTLIGTEGPEKTIVDGNEKDRVLFVENCEGRVTVAGMTFQRGYTTGNGGGIHTALTRMNIDNCHFFDNEAENEGGGVSITQATSYSFSNCVIERNRSGASAGLSILGGEGEAHHNRIRGNAGGLGVALQFTGCYFHDNLIVRNEATEFGPVGYLFPIGGRVIGNTIAFNTGKTGSGALLVQGGKARVERNLVSNNQDLFGLNIESADRLIEVADNITWNNDAGSFTGLPPDESNIDADPLFCDPDRDDYSVRAGSPCLPGGERGLVGARGQGCD